MRTTVTTIFILLLGTAIPLHAQEKGFSLGAFASSTLFHRDVGAGDATAFGGDFSLTSSDRFRLGFGLAYTWDGATALAGRPYSSYHSSVDFQGTLFGSESRVFVHVSPGLHWFRMGALGALPPENQFVPGVGVGMGAEMALLAGFGVEAKISDEIQYATAGALDGVPAATRSLTHSPRLQMGIRWTYRRSPATADLGPSSLSMSSSYQEAGGRETRSDASTPHRHSDSYTEVLPDGTRREEKAADLLGVVVFESGAFSVQPGQVPVLADVAAYLSANPDAHVEVRAFTSDSGARAYNESLAERRASEVRRHLVVYYQVAPYRIHAVGGGADPSATESGARRAEIRVLRVISR